MLTVKIDDGITAVDIEEGSYIWFRQGENTPFIEWRDLCPAERTAILDLRDRIVHLNGELAEILKALEIKKAA
ncbi:hypothetical protein [Geobacter sp. AOG2]|uniref:hypothetical protein n=1 Tax=Geobacter sp. AOG2 TaxID=1566347 RepID=UPI001CC79486|nr:hypothetical protein [Geobacter sp. AOG2]GFE60965.1 hypothetical protein AOG2_15520 [Geobacter sp. AOG2]